VVDRAARGEPITITKAGEPVAELRPVSRRAISAEVLLAHWRALPAVDPARVRRDIDAALDPEL
jgi:antitoxin (DNA-binding transcriptional repressor) of toxin-antitoxin stability system